ncbi:hypothetical protein ACG83_04485 [Frankia sp. R43]|uniref:hypothetical protein n=1 Tax=Frankia sp. R43 TaxID=269536 RepID=UPI0006C9FCAD|nr:hypothetical protein [Frankia sp. R43]KPM57056.1 hypothetical protein ACG83_04485 [Frankia sp. R43]
MAPSGPPVQRRIGLWGATQSGKTTMLAALQIAAGQQVREDRWMVIGANPASSTFLSRNVDVLTTDKKFPVATEAAEPLSWLFYRPDPAPRGLNAWLRRRFRRPLATGQQVFEVNTLDVGGYMFRNHLGEVLDDPYHDYYDDEDEGLPLFDPEQTAGADADEVMRAMADCDGLVYLFDPVTEHREQNSFQYFARVLDQIGRLSHESGRIRNGRLPHYLAVCVNKIDDPGIYRVASQNGYMLSGDNDLLLPEVPREYAAELFERLCDGREAGGAAQVRRIIRRFFDPDRVAYFATSSIGFYVQPGRLFRHRDNQNVISGPDGRPRIRGEIRPINVLEPFLWLEDEIRRNPLPPPIIPEPAESPESPEPDSELDSELDSDFSDFTRSGPPPDL